MPAKIFSAAIVGLDAQIVEVEVESSYGLRHFEIVGLPDKAVQESKERVGAAIQSSGLQSPHRQPLRVLVSLAPADLKKEGSLYDLPIALGFLTASKQTKFAAEGRLFLGELSLDGTLKSIKGTLAIALMAKNKGYREIILPWPNVAEAALIENIKTVGVKSLKETIDYLEGRKEIHSFKINNKNIGQEETNQTDLSWIKGQEFAKRALEITAAGGHHLFLQGPPGTGKTMLAKALPSILPPLSLEEALEVTKIYSINGLLTKEKPLITVRPFRSPHHTSSEIALIGGGNPPRPGEITLAHQGVLFLDEFPEFHRDVLESLRQPIEEGKVTILRTGHSLTLPARFTLIAASNPCPCGNLGDSDKRCVCTSSQISMYRRKLSGPLMDRIDLFITAPKIKYEKLTAPGSKENPTTAARERVKKARQAQKERFGLITNSEMTLQQIKKYCQVDSKSEDLLKKYVDSGRLSARGYHRVLRAARTIADLDNSEKVLYPHISEALIYRTREA